MRLDATRASSLAAFRPLFFLTPLILMPAVAAPGADFIRGDVNLDGELNLHDADLIYGRGNGSGLACLDAADVDDDGKLTDADALALLEYLYSEGDAPPAPFPSPGPDPTDDALDCSSGEAGGPLVAGDFSVDFTPVNTGYRGAVDLHAAIEVPESVSGVWFRLGFDSSPFTRVTVSIPDALKGVGRFTAGKLTDTGAEVAVLFSSSGQGLPAGLTAEALKISLCLSSPSPHPSWDFPLEVEEAGFSIAGQPRTVKGIGAAVTVDVEFGIGHFGEPQQPGCFFEPPAPDFFTCMTLQDGRVELSWSNPVVYDQIEIFRGTFFGYSDTVRLPGDAISWIDEGDPGANNYVYSIQGYISPRQRSEAPSCTASDPREPVHFLRGDANSDGLISLSDFVAIARRHVEDLPLPCPDAADVDDDGSRAGDMSALLHCLGIVESSRFSFDQPPAPFPDPGPDPTHDGEQFYSQCDEYAVTPAESSSDDVITIGAASAQPGEIVEVPIFLTNTRAVDALQIVLQYDPELIAVTEPGADALAYEGAFYEQFFNRQFPMGNGLGTYGNRPGVSSVQAYPGEGILVISIVGGFFSWVEPFTVPPGENTLVARLRLRVSGDAVPGSTIELTPTEPLPGEGFGLYRLRSEITVAGGGRYPAVVPETVPGVLKIGIDGDISFFTRGDANGDSLVDLSDVVAGLRLLFLGGVETDCPDAFDSDDSGELELADPIVILRQLFYSTATIQPPYPDPGRDPTPDFLSRCTRGSASNRPR